MADFREIRTQFQQARNRCVEIDRSLFRLRERLKKVERRKEKVRRVIHTDNPQSMGQLAELDAQSMALEGEIIQVKGVLEASIADCHTLFEGFADFSDPRTFVGNLDDRFPFLLFPLRIETRFKNLGVDANGTNQQELWVRVFPDDALVDSFEETLSDAELEGIRLFWQNYWKAGGIETQERGAWMGLVNNFGAGRSGYLFQQYQPINQDAIPVKANSQDIILVISTNSPVPAAEQVLISNFWRAIWVANEEQIATQAAFTDLINALGEPRANEIVNTLAPFNLSDIPESPFSREEVEVQLTFLLFPAADQTDTQEQSWSRAPRVNFLPDRLVFLGYEGEEVILQVLGNPIPSPLFVGPDPLAEEENQLQQEEGNLKVSEDLKWMVDFETAVSIGMGFKIRLDPIRFRAGFDKIMVVGLRLSADEQEAKTELETLFHHHHYGANGFSLLPQGTPTNNSEKKGSGHSQSEDADDSFTNYVKAEGLIETTTDWMLKKDGQILSEMLGIDLDVFHQVPNANGTDQCEAKALNVALWPSTLGYFMESMMQPVFSENTIAATKNFFNRFVSGRGYLPAIRIGEQPYGILTTAAFSKLNWMNPRRDDDHPNVNFLGNTQYFYELHKILRTIQSDWNVLLDKVAYIGKKGPGVDAHQILLDAVGLNPNSVKFYQRYAESFEQLYNRLNLMGLGNSFPSALIAIGLLNSGKNLLGKLGHPPSDNMDDLPEVLKKFFYTKQNLLRGPFVDDRPLSEADPVRVYTEDNKNYLEWLIDAARTSHNALRKQEGFLENKRPSALLYLMLHHALDLGYVDAGLFLHVNAAVLQPQQAFQARIEPAFLHILDKKQGSPSESKWSYLYKTDQRITDNDDLQIAEFIPSVLNSTLLNSSLNRQLTALEHLKETPTARLERIFTEHLDCCNYRLDAWKSGIMNYQLEKVRNSGTTPGTASNTGELMQGIYLGAFGWLEDIRPEHKQMEPVELNDELSEIFNQPGEPPLMRDSTNAGYIHAPSLNHAVTAAILRNGYLSNATPENPDALSVNLSSERVRKALGIIEGIRNGQSLAALLGYQLERALHDRHDVEVDFYIYQLRKAFPLTGDRFKSTRTGKSVSIKAIEARNVVDGLALIEHIQKTGNSSYPFGEELSEEGMTNAIRSAINEEVNRIANINDAVSDLAIAESVHQVVQGNYDRAAATLDTYSKGNFPPVPDVIQTPRSGRTITHRFAIHLESELGATEPLTNNPRRITEPAVDNWLISLLPAAENIACQVYVFPTNDPDNQTSHEITVADLGLDSIDLLYMMNNEADQGATILDELIFYHVQDQFSPRPDMEVNIAYLERITDKVSFFELAPLIRSIRACVLRSRPLRAGDAMLPIEANDEAEVMLHVEDQRLVQVRSKLSALASDLKVNFVDVLEPITEVEDISVNQAVIIANIDQWARDYLALLQPLSLFGFLKPSITSIFDKKRNIYRQLIQLIRATSLRWEEKLSAFDEKIIEFTNLPVEATDQERFELLQFAEGQISTVPIIPLPPDPATFNNNLQHKRTAFVNKQNALNDLLNTNAMDLSTLLEEIGNWMVGPAAISEFDTESVDLSHAERQILIFAEDLYQLTSSLHSNLLGRDQKAQDHLEAFANAASAKQKAEAIQETAKVLLSEDFKIFPEFTMIDDQHNEWINAWNDRATLLQFQQTEKSNLFPVEDWMHGVARVREKIHRWENLSFLAEALKETEPLLEPLQFPYRSNDRWLALEFLTEEEAALREEERSFKVDSERLLYTAHYATGNFESNKRQCGLLLDEWTEVIPTLEETTGVAFHYDRPNSEPPQTLMLVLPTDYTGNWRWNDLLNALNETLEMAKMRAIEPDQIDDTAYSRLLPATISSTTIFPITASLNYSMNNQFYTLINTQSDE